MNSNVSKHPTSETKLRTPNDRNLQVDMLLHLSEEAAERGDFVRANALMDQAEKIVCDLLWED